MLKNDISDEERPSYLFNPRAISTISFHFVSFRLLHVKRQWMSVWQFIRQIRQWQRWQRKWWDSFEGFSAVEYTGGQGQVRQDIPLRTLMCQRVQLLVAYEGRAQASRQDSFSNKKRPRLAHLPTASLNNVCECSRSKTEPAVFGHSRRTCKCKWPPAKGKDI